MTYIGLFPFTKDFCIKKTIFNREKLLSSHRKNVSKISPRPSRATWFWLSAETQDWRERFRHMAALRHRRVSERESNLINRVRTREKRIKHG